MYLYMFSIHVQVYINYMYMYMYLHLLQDCGLVVPHVYLLAGYSAAVFVFSLSLQVIVKLLQCYVTYDTLP